MNPKPARSPHPTTFLEPTPLPVPAGARWIWGAPLDTSYFPTNTYWKFRRDFSWKEGSARLRVTASTRYQLFLNGRLIGEGPSPCDPAHQVVDWHDLTPHLHPGANQLAVLVHHCGTPTFNYMPAPGGLLAWSEGLEENLATNSRWLVARADEWNPHSEKRALQLVQSEIIDLRRREHGWQTKELDPEGRQSNNFGAFWRPAYELTAQEFGPWQGYVERSIPFLRLDPLVEARQLVRTARVKPAPDPWDIMHLAKQIERELPIEEVDATEMRAALASGEAVTIAPDPAGDLVLLFELPAYHTGYFVLEAEGGAGGAIDVSAGEALFRGWVNPRYPKMLSANFTHRVVLADGANEWRSFHWGAARYLQLTVRPGLAPIRLRRAGMIPSGYPLDLRGSFESSDPELDWLWKTGADTTRLCLHEVVTDCPTREQAQWIEHVTGPVCWAAYGDPHLIRKMLIQVSESELPGAPGCLRTPWPAAIPFQTRGAWTNLPDQQMVWMDLIRQHDELFDDPALLERLFPVVERAVAYHRSALNEEGLLDYRKFPEGTWLWIDWGQNYKRDEVASLNFLHISTLRSCAVLAERLGKEALAAKWRAWADALAERAREVFFDPALGLFCEDRERKRPSQIASVFAVRAEACPPEDAAEILRNALNPPPGADTAGTHFFIYLLPLCIRHGLGKEALDWMREKYSEMFALRVPALWENFSMGGEIQPEGPYVADLDHRRAEERAHCQLQPYNGDSRCHAYSAAPTLALSRHVAGVRPAGPGAVIIEPQIDLLEHCRAVVVTGPHEVKVAWQREPDGRTRLQWEVPEGVRVSLLPWQKDAPSRGELFVNS